jgi:hypothetical protein
MTADILIAIAIGENIGRRARLTVWTTNQVGVAQDGALLTSGTFDESVVRAKIDSLHLLGDPLIEGGFRWRLDKFPSNDVVSVPNLAGDSLYGAFTLTFLQLIAKTSPRQAIAEATCQTLALLPAIQGSSLSKVAVSAAPSKCNQDCCSGIFGTVGGIREKLRSLAMLDGNDLMTCIIARGQEIPANTFQPENNGRALRKVPTMEAHDAVDAFGKLFELQTRNALGRYI